MPPFRKRRTCRPRCAARERSASRAASDSRSRCSCCSCTTPGVPRDATTSRPTRRLLSLAASPRAAGSNAVNVIIVDIRAMDTNGEITVLVVVGLCVYGLLRARRGAERADGTSRAILRTDRPRHRRFAVPLSLLVASGSSCRATTCRAAASSPACSLAAAGAMYLLAFGIERAARVPWWRVVGASACSSRCSPARCRSCAGEPTWTTMILAPAARPYHLPTATFFDLGVDADRARHADDHLRRARPGASADDGAPARARDRPPVRGGRLLDPAPEPDPHGDRLRAVSRTRSTCS